MNCINIDILCKRLDGASGTAGRDDLAGQAEAWIRDVLLFRVETECNGIDT